MLGAGVYINEYFSEKARCGSLDRAVYDVGYFGRFVLASYMLQKKIDHFAC